MPISQFVLHSKYTSTVTKLNIDYQKLFYSVKLQRRAEGAGTNFSSAPWQ